jgi:hypothetical protein
LVNTIYGRWWHPLDEKPGVNPVPKSPLPWTGEYKDGLGNMIRMLAYANPEKIAEEKQRADGYGIVRFNKTQRTITIECWPRFSDHTQGDRAQFPGWPITIGVDDNDGRKPAAWLPELSFARWENPVVQVADDKTGEVVSVVRVRGKKYQPPVYKAGSYTVKVGKDQPNEVTLPGLVAGDKASVGTREVK